MTQMQQNVNEMYNGNTDAIIAGIESDNDYLVMNAILSGSAHKIDDERFIAGVEKAQRNETVLLGYPIKSVAEASYHFITGKKYRGNDDIVETLLKNKFRI